METDKKHRVTATLTTDQYMNCDEWLGGLTLTQKILSEIEIKKDRSSRENAGLGPGEITVFDN